MSNKLDMADALAQGADPDVLLAAAKAGGQMQLRAISARMELADIGIGAVKTVIAVLKKKSAPESKLEAMQVLLTESVVQSLAAALDLKETDYLTAMQQLRLESGNVRAVSDLEQLVNKTLRKLQAHVEGEASEAKKARLTVDPVGVQFDKDQLLSTIVKQSGIPTGLVMPAEYEIDGGRVWLLKVGRDGDVFREEVVRALVFPAGRLRDVDAGEEHVVLIWKAPGGWLRRAFRMDEVMVIRNLAALSRYGVPVDSNSAASVVKWLRAFIQANERTLPVARTSPRMGWRDKPNTDEEIEGFLWGSSWLTGKAISNGDINAVDPAKWSRTDDSLYLSVQQEGLAQIAQGYKSRGTLAGWNEAIRPLLDYPRAYLGVLASLVPPLLRFTPQASNFVVDWSARSSFGKTTTLLAAASVWGLPDIRGGGAIHSWGSSDTYIERVAGTAGDLPIILDDTRRAKANTVIRDVVMSVAQGLGRGRGTISGIQRTQTWRTVLLSSGEESIIDLVQVGGAAARTLAILDPPFPEESGDIEALIRRLEVSLAANHGVAGPAICQWLASDPVNRKRMEPAWTEAAEYLSTIAPKGAFAQRAVRYLASLALAYDVAGAVGIIRPPRIEPLFEVVWGALRSSTDAADLETRALQYVFSRIQQRPEAFYGREKRDSDGPKAPACGWWGVWAGNSAYSYIAMYPTQLETLLREGGFVGSAILRGWSRREWIRKSGSGTTYPVKVNGDQVRMVCIRREGLVAAGVTGDIDPGTSGTQEPMW